MSASVSRRQSTAPVLPFVRGDMTERRRYFKMLFKLAFRTQMTEFDLLQVLMVIYSHPKVPSMYHTHGLPENVHCIPLHLGDGYSNAFMFSSTDNHASEERKMLVIMDLADDGDIDIVACQYSATVAAMLPQLDL